MTIDTDIDGERDFDASDASSDNAESHDAHDDKGLEDEPFEDESDCVSQKEPSQVASKGVSIGTLCVFSALAALIGGGIGAFAPRYLDPANAAPAQAITRNSVSLSALSEQVTWQQNSLGDIQADLADANNTLGNISRLSARVQSVEQAVDAQAQIDISAERAAALSPLFNKIDAMETLMASEEMPEGAPSLLLSRLDALEGKLEELRVSLATIPPSATLSYREGVTGGEGASPANELSSNPKAQDETDFDLSANFPREQLLSVLQTQERAEANPTWLRRLFSKHVQVRDTNAVDPRDIIDQAQTLVNIGDIRGAINALESLNPSLRAAAQPWIVQAQKTL